MSTELSDIKMFPDIESSEDIDVKKLTAEFVELSKEFEELREAYENHTHSASYLNVYVEGNTEVPG